MKLSKVENRPEVTFHPSGMAREIIEDVSLSDDRKKELLVSLGPEAGEFVSDEVNK